MERPKEASNRIKQHPWKLTKFKDTTQEKEKVKVKGRQKKSQIGQHGDLVQEVPGKVEEEEKAKVEEKEKARAKERKVKAKQKERKEVREVKVAKEMIGADCVAKQATGEMNAPIEW